MDKKNLNFAGDLHFFSDFVEKRNSNVFEQINLDIVTDEEELQKSVIEEFKKNHNTPRKKNSLNKSLN